jgi:hypothetical protein
MPTPKVFTLFLAGATDVETEHAIVKDIVADWNALHAEPRGAYINFTSWRDSAFPDAGAEPQAILNRQLVDSADVVVGVFWTRFGTPTSTAGSGTEEEIRRSIAAGKKVLVYFSDRPIPPSKLDSEQYARIQEFKKQYGTKGLYWSVGTSDEFRDEFRKHLALTVKTLLEHPNEQASPTSAAVPLIPIAFPPASWLAIVVSLNMSVRGSIARIEELQAQGIPPQAVDKEEGWALTTPILARAKILHILAEGGHVQNDPNHFLSYESIMRNILQSFGEQGKKAG